MLNKFLKWHEDMVMKWMDLLRLEPYHMYWIAFIKGIILTLLIQWLI